MRRKRAVQSRHKRYNAILRVAFLFLLSFFSMNVDDKTNIGRGRKEGHSFVRKSFEGGEDSDLGSLHSGSVSASPIGNIATGPAAANLALYASGSNQRIGACFRKMKND